MQLRQELKSMNKSPIEVEHDPASKTLLTGFSRIAMALRSKAWKEASLRGLTPTQGQILTFLSTREDARLTDVAKALAISAPTASDAVATLERKGLLRKQISRTDPRAISLRLTATGRREVHRSAAGTNFLQRAIESLSAVEQEALLILLIKLLNSMHQNGEAGSTAMCITCVHFQAFVTIGAENPHRCSAYNSDLGNTALRLDCPRYGKASEEQTKTVWENFSKGLAAAAAAG
jgi:DNA-binding MarR family transcriptional regulator